VALPRPALLPNVPLGCILEQLFLFVKCVKEAKGYAVHFRMVGDWCGGGGGCGREAGVRGNERSPFDFAQGRLSARLGMTVGVVCKAGAGLLATRGPSTLVGTTGGR
jgi:hypothetical protein